MLFLFTTAIFAQSIAAGLVSGGFATWAAQNGAGACGKVYKDTDNVISLPTKVYARGVNCGRLITVYGMQNRTSVSGRVADEDSTLENDECLGLSLAMFEEFAPLSVGQFPISYEFQD